MSGIPFSKQYRPQTSVARKMSKRHLINALRLVTNLELAQAERLPIFFK